MNRPSSSPPVGPALRIYLLGPLRLEGSAGPIPLPTKVASLLAYLLLHPDPQSRERLAALFWGDVPDDRARHSLRTALNHLRKELGEELLIGDRDYAQLNPAFPLWVDVREFERQLASMTEARHDELSFVELYRGDLLADLYDDWIFPERERYSQRYQDALLLAVQRLRSQSDFAGAIALAHRVLAQDPANERAHQHLMFCHAANGDRSAALEHYAACRRALRDQLDVEPSPETEALHDWVKRTPARAREALITNLPIPLTSFVGREQELARIKAILAPARPLQPAPAGPKPAQELRLLTLTGVGGSGKTRLALQAGLELVDGFRDGAWWVDFAPLAAEELAPQAVARALGIPERPREPPIETLKSHLRSREILLLLDNCEHLIEVCADLAAALLAACPGLKILATSRAALGVAGERVFRVPTLALPNPGEQPAVAALRQFSAVELFLARASAADPGFALTEANAPNVVQICTQLDGIPLAIELAASRLRVLTIEQIAERLAGRFDLLTGGSRTALPRHRTLRATLDWSYGLLAEQEQLLFEYLSVFAGGWTLEAAEAVCAGSPVPADHVLDLLAQLTDKSLVERQPNGPEARHRMLETLRQYAAGLLERIGAQADVRRRHALYYAGLAERAEQGLYSPEMESWLARLESEHENFRIALGWSLGRDAPEVSLRFAPGLARFWTKRGYLREGAAWLERLLEASAEAPPQLRVRALAPAGSFAWMLGDYRRAAALNEEAEAICRQVGDRSGLVIALAQRSEVDMYSCEFAGAHAHLREGLALCEELGDRRRRASFLIDLATVMVFNLEWDAEARSYCEEGLALVAELGDKSEQGHAHQILGLGAHFEADDQRAAGHLEQAVRFCRESGDRRMFAWSVGLLGLGRHWQGRAAEGWSLARECLRMALELGETTLAACALQWLAVLVTDRGEAAWGVRLMSCSYAWGETFGFRLAPMMRAIDDAGLDAMRDALGEAAYAAAWAEGQAMDPEQAFAFVLGDAACNEQPSA